MTRATRLKKTNLHHCRILCHIGSRDLPRRSGYYKHMWYADSNNNNTVVVIDLSLQSSSVHRSTETMFKI